MIYFKYSIWWIHANFSLYILVHISKHLSVFHNAILFHSWKKYNFQIHFICLSFLFFLGGGVIICEISKITVNFWQLAIFLTTLYMYLNLIILNSVEPEKNFKIPNDLQYDYTVVAPGPQTHFKISVVFRIYHNVCNIRVQTIYTYKNLNNSGEKW